MEPVATTSLNTPLYSLHLELGARMVPFAGYSMPVQYPTGIKTEHEHTRNAAGLFDISHMGQIRIEGDDVANLLETLVPGDIQSLQPGQQRYSVLTNSEGGVIDDLMITRMPDHFFLVVNASRKQLDYDYIKAALQSRCQVSMLADRALLALQGPEAVSVLADLNPAISQLPFLGAAEFNLGGVESLLHRCGYTGEDGFEISLAGRDIEPFARRLLDDPRVKPIGLGARDSLRLEAGLCLYGHELDETITPIEAGLTWVIAKKYRMANAEPAQFPGAAAILQQISAGPARIRKGFRAEGKIPVRDGTIILDSQGAKAGIISSGGYGPTVGGPVAMGYVTNNPPDNTEYHVEIRNQRHKIVPVDLPFVKHRYHTTKSV
jgi:aminomethyltransferase